MNRNFENGMPGPQQEGSLEYGGTAYGAMQSDEGVIGYPPARPTLRGPVRDISFPGDTPTDSTLKALINDTHDTITSAHKLADILAKKLAPVLDPREDAKISQANSVSEPTRGITAVECEIEKMYTQARKLRGALERLHSKVRI